ncbi:hypothetical protein EDB92DRAFT_1837179, partial [Lactarius akahatsu]
MVTSALLLPVIRSALLALLVTSTSAPQSSGTGQVTGAIEPSHMLAFLHPCRLTQRPFWWNMVRNRASELRTGEHSPNSTLSRWWTRNWRCVYTRGNKRQRVTCHALMSKN